MPVLSVSSMGSKVSRGRENEDQPIATKRTLSPLDEAVRNVPGATTQKFFNQRMRRSPCFDQLVAACRRPRPTGEGIIADLLQSHPEFFRSSPDATHTRQTLYYKTLLSLDYVLGFGLVSRPIDSVSNNYRDVIPNNLLGYDEIDRKNVLSQGRVRALQYANAIHVGSAADIEFEVDPILTEQLTGYPFERPADIIRNYGADLIDQEFSTSQLFSSVVARHTANPVFIGPRIPQAAIIAIHRAGKCIWRRPTEMMETAPNPRIPDSGTRFDRILNVAIGIDDDVTLAQRYLHRKHPSKTDNYLIHSPEVEGAPLHVERTSTPPNTARQPKTVQIHIVGSQDVTKSIPPFGETSFSELCKSLATLVKERRWAGEIGLESKVLLDFIACGVLSEEQKQELQDFFRARKLSPPSIAYRDGIVNSADTSSFAGDIDFIVGLSPNQSSIRHVQKLQQLYPSAVAYNIRRPGPSVRTPVLYRTATETLATLRPPETLRINIISHGNGTNELNGISLMSLVKELVTLVYKGQQTGEFNAEAKVTLNFVSCKVPPDQLTLVYQAFEEKNIRLVRSIHRNMELMIDTAGRKLQQNPVGMLWQHAHLKKVFEFDVNGKPQEVQQVKSISDWPNLFTLQNAAGPLAEGTEARYHINKLTEALDILRKENQLSEDWRPELESVVKMFDGSYRMNFRRAENIFPVITRNQMLEAFDVFTKTHAKRVGSSHRFDDHVLTAMESPKLATNFQYSISYFNRLLGSMSAVRTLIDFHRQIKSPYIAEIRAHTLMNVAQSVHVLGNESAILLDNMRSALKRGPVLEETGSYAAKFFAAVNRTVGRGFLATNVGFDIHELNQATTPEEKLRAGIALSLDGAMLTLEGANALGLASATTGPLGLLLGLGAFAFEMGATLYQQHGQAQSSLEAVFRYFENIKQSYTGDTVRYDVNRDLLSFAPAAVITSMVLDDASKIQFGSQKLMVGEYKITCQERLNPFRALVPILSKTMKKYPLDIRDKMGWANEKEIPKSFATASNVLLPASPITNLSYGYYNYGKSLLSNSEGASILKQLDMADPSFIFKNCGLTMNSLTPMGEETPIHVRLGLRDRTLFMPPNLHREIGKYLKYTLEGGGGNYRLFPARDAHFTLRESANAASNWLIDLSEFEEVNDFDYSLTEGSLIFHDSVRGPIQINIAEVEGMIEIRSKQRVWRLDRNSMSLRLAYWNLGGDEILGSEGAKLQGGIKKVLNLISVLELANKSRLQTNWNLTPELLARFFKAHSIKTTDRLRMDRFPTGNGTGTVIYDTQNRHVITSGSINFPHAKFVDEVDSSAYFSQGNIFWKRMGGDHTPIKEQSLFFAEASRESHVTHVWSQNGTTFVSQRITLQKEQEVLEAVYGLNEAGQPKLVQLVLPMEALSARIPSGALISASEVFHAINELLSAPQKFIPSAVVPTATRAHLILLVLRNKQKEERRFWLDTNHNVFIDVDPNLPSDVIPVATTQLLGLKQVLFFYSATTKSLYRRNGNNGLFAGSRSTRLMEKLRGLKLVDGRLHVENQDGVVYEVNAAGNQQVVMLTSQWLKTRRATWADDVAQLCRGEGIANIVEIKGLQLANGKSLPCWYDKSQKQFTFAPEQLANEKSLHLGSITKEAGAWLFQPGTGRLYQQPTFTSEWAKVAVDHNGILRSSLLQLSAPNMVLPNEWVDRATRFEDGRVVVMTRSGLTLLLEPGNRPLMLAVDQNWLSRETHPFNLLAHLISDENYRFHGNIALPVGT